MPAQVSEATAAIIRSARFAINFIIAFPGRFGPIPWKCIVHAIYPKPDSTYSFKRCYVVSVALDYEKISSKSLRIAWEFLNSPVFA